MRPDWYQATLDVPPQVVIDALGQQLGAVRSEDRRGRNGYRHQTVIVGDDDDQLAVVQHGGNGDRPNVQGSGQDAPDVARVIRANWPEHDVTRIDVAADVVAEGSFDQLFELCRRVAGRSRTKGLLFLPDDLSDGRTYRLGSPKSECLARLYDKTAERRAKQPASTHGDIPEGWTRLELQVRPKRARRRSLAYATSEQVWGSSKWSQDLAHEVFKLDVDFLDAPRPPSSDVRAFRTMMAQYGASLGRLDDAWGHSELMAEIEQGIADAKARAAR